MPITRDEKKLEKLEKRLQQKKVARESRNKAAQFLFDAIRGNLAILGVVIAIVIIAKALNMQDYIKVMVLSACLFYILWAIYKFEAGKSKK